MRAIVALENSDNNNNIPKDKPYPKLSKASLHDTRSATEAEGVDTEKNKEKVTTADVT